MAKFAFVLLALAAVASANPIGVGGIGGGVVSKSHQTVARSHIITPGLGLGGLGGIGGIGGLGGLGLGYGILGSGLVGQSVHSSVGHTSVIPHYGLGLGHLGGLRGLGLWSLYPGGVGVGYGYGALGGGLLG